MPSAPSCSRPRPSQKPPHLCAPLEARCIPLMMVRTMMRAIAAPQNSAGDGDDNDDGVGAPFWASPPHRALAPSISIEFLHLVGCAFQREARNLAQREARSLRCSLLGRFQSLAPSALVICCLSFVIYFFPPNMFTHVDFGFSGAIF